MTLKFLRHIHAALILTWGAQATTALAATQPEEWFVYVGTYTGEKSRGIYLARFNSKTGELTKPELAAEMKSPSFLAAHPEKSVIYAVSESWEAGQPDGSVHGFAVDRRNGKLYSLGEQSSAGKGPCHLAVDKKGKCVLVANYGSGSIASLGLGKNGELGEPKSVIQHRGASVNQQRQTGPHAHQIVPDPSNQHALVCDLGLDKVLVYELEPKKPMLTPNVPYGVPIKPGSGPRHLAFHPDGEKIYVLNELACTIDVFEYGRKRGSLSPVQTISTLPEGFDGDNTCAEIQVHPSGRFLYASNRGHDSIAGFRVEEGSGTLSLIEHRSTGGKIPRYFGVDPSGRWLIAANQQSDTLRVFRIDLESGKLASTGLEQAVGKPVCLLFVAPALK